MEARTQERRRHTRHTPSRDITGKVKSTMDFRVIDISEGGLQVETRLGLPPATVCDLKLRLNGQEVTLRAEVRRCRAQLTKTDGKCKVSYHSGLEFVDLEDEESSRVRQIISESCVGDEIDDQGVAVNQGAVVSGSLYTV